MAEYGKLNFSVSFNPTSAFPLDARYYWDSKSAADEAAATAVEVGSSESVYHHGEQFVVVEGGKATVYVIQPDKSLAEIGSSAVGDGKSIEVVDGKLVLKGFGEAEDGQQLRIRDGQIEWFSPDTSTVEGLSSTVAGNTSDINDLKGRMTAAEGDLTTLKGDGEGSVKRTAKDAATDAINTWAQQVSEDETVNTFKELVDWAAQHTSDVGELTASIQGAESDIDALESKVGSKSVSEQIQEALNPDGEQKYADKSAVDTLQGTVNSLQSDLEQAQTDISGKVDKVAGSRLMTEDEGTKLTGIEEGAQVNKIETVDTEFSISEKKLKLNAISMDKVTGLAEAIESAKQSGIQTVKVNGIALVPEEQAVDIPLATAEKLGVVKGTDKENGVAIGEDGTMTVNSLNINKLVQTDGEFLVLDGGSAEE